MKFNAEHSFSNVIFFNDLNKSQRNPGNYLIEMGIRGITPAQKLCRTHIS